EPFQALDETYKNMWLSPRVQPLLITDNPNSDRLLAWIGPCAPSRGVAIQLGHGPTIFSKPEYRTVGHNAIPGPPGRRKAQSRAGAGLFCGRLKRGTAMKLGLYSITYLGLWYRGEALPLPAMITRAKQYGYDGIEIDGKRPHGNPLDWPTPRCRELRSI